MQSMHLLQRVYTAHHRIDSTTLVESSNHRQGAHGLRLLDSNFLGARKPMIRTHRTFISPDGLFSMPLRASKSAVLHYSAQNATKLAGQCCICHCSSICLYLRCSLMDL